MKRRRKNSGLTQESPWQAALDIASISKSRINGTVSNIFKKRKNMIAQSPSEQPLQNYAIYANEFLMERHFGVLPHPDRWVVFGKLGRGEKPDRFIHLICKYHATGPLSWNSEDGATFALLVIDDEVLDLIQLWREACGVYDCEEED